MRRISNIGGMFPFKAYEPHWPTTRAFDKVWTPFMDSLNEFDPYHTIKLWVDYTTSSVSMGGVIYKSDAKISLSL